jgi:3-oxoacyl-[acyl-carrier-protein] synthase-1
VVAKFAANQQAIPYRVLKDDAVSGIEERIYRVLETVIARALDAAELTQAERRATGLFIGSSSFDISSSEARYRRELDSDANAIPLSSSSSLGNLAVALRERFDFRGPDYSFNTACTASANALVYADAMVRAGRLEHALVVGAELFNVLTALGFHGLQLLAPGNMKPFDRARNGLVLGEGCSAVVIGPQARRDRSMYLRGSANVCDTHSISAANPDGSSIANVIAEALRSAALSPDDIAAIKVHGTASLLNDEAEAAGMKRVFSDIPPLSALKPYIGHTLGACGLNELVLFCGAAEQGFLIGTPGICAGDSDLGITLNQTATDLAPGNYMLNYFGFGGSNTSLVIGSVEG